MNFGDLKEELLLLVDSGTDEIDAKAGAYINEALIAIAQAPGVYLRSLKTIASIDTVIGQNYTNFPDIYDKKLRLAYVNGNKVSCYNDLEDLFTTYPDMDAEGSVEALSLENNILWYVRTPATVETITALLFKNPTELVADADENTDIPPHLHRHTILPYAAALMFKILEQGKEDEVVNLRVQEAIYAKGIQSLIYWTAARSKNIGTSIWNV